VRGFDPIPHPSTDAADGLEVRGRVFRVTSNLLRRGRQGRLAPALSWGHRRRQVAREKWLRARSIRHAGQCPALTVGSLSVAVIESALGGLLVKTIRPSTLFVAVPRSAALTAVTLSTVTGPADPEQRTAERVATTALSKNKLTALAHPCPGRAMDKDRRLWEAEWRSEGWLPLPGVTLTNPGRCERPGFSLSPSGSHDTKASLKPSRLPVRDDPVHVDSRIVSRILRFQKSVGSPGCSRAGRSTTRCLPRPCRGPAAKHGAGRESKSR